MATDAREYYRDRAVRQYEAPAASTDHRCWTRLPGGRWTCVLSGSREQCYTELTRRIGGSVTGVVLPAGQQPPDDLPPQPPAQSAAVPGPTRPPAPAAPAANQYARTHVASPANGTARDRAWQQQYDRQLRSALDYQRLHGPDEVRTYSAVHEDMQATPPDAPRLLGLAQPQVAVPKQFSREDRDRAIRLAEVDGIDFALAVERVRQAG